METGLPNGRCSSSLVFPATFFLPLLARDFRFGCASVSEVAEVCKGECEIGGKGTVGATDSALSGADVPPTSRGPLRIESGELWLDCSTGVATVASAAGWCSPDFGGGGLPSSGTVEVRRKVVLRPWLSPRVSLVSLVGFARDRDGDDKHQMWYLRQWYRSVSLEILSFSPEMRNFGLSYLWEVKM